MSQIMNFTRALGKNGGSHAAFWMSPKTMCCRSFAQFADITQIQRKVWGVEYVSDVRPWEKDKPNTPQSEEQLLLPRIRSSSVTCNVSETQRNVWGIQYVSDKRPWEQQKAANHAQSTADGR